MFAARNIDPDRAAHRIEVELKSECPTHTYRSALDHSGGFAAADSRAVTKSLLARWAVGMPGAVLALIEDVNGSGFQETHRRLQVGLRQLADAPRLFSAKEQVQQFPNNLIGFAELARIIERVDHGRC
jgi:hypothetical protein